jgi:hypothetical protein
VVDINGLMNDVEDEIRVLLGGKVIRLEDVIGKVKVLVVPVLNEQKRIISHQDISIRNHEQTILELTESADMLEGEKEDREKEDERQELIRLFNSCGGKVVYS